MQIAIVHYTNNIATIGADSNAVDVIVYSSNIEKQTTAVDIDETHNPILWQNS